VSSDGPGHNYSSGGSQNLMFEDSLLGDVHDAIFSEISSHEHASILEI